MALSDTVKQARQLHRDGQVDEAETLLLRQGYEERLDEKAQAEYRRLFPLPEAIKSKLADYDVRLREDAAVRVKAAKEIARQALAAPSVKAQAWMRNPWTTEWAAGHLTNENPAVRENMVVALAMIFLRYFKDQRAFEPLIPHLKSGRPTERLWACQALGHLGEKSLKHILPMIYDRAKLVRSEALSQLGILMHRASLSESAKAEIRAALLAAPRDGEVSFRTAVASRLLPVARPEDADELTAWKKTETSKVVKNFLQQVIDRITDQEGGHPPSNSIRRP